MKHMRWALGLITIIFSLLIIVPLFHSGYPPTHDGLSVVIRVADMIRLVKDGQFPPRYSGYLNHGYGYPLFNFAYPFPYYLGVFFHLFRLGPVDTTKAIFAVSVPLSALFMFLAAGKLWRNPWAGSISAILYAYLPYRIVNLYVRGSIGESLGTVLYPLIIWLGLIFFESKKPRHLVIATAVSFAVLITTHNIMAIYVLPIIGMLLLAGALAKKYGQSLLLGLSLVLSFGLSAYFWVPAILEKKLVLLSGIPIADRSLYFLKLSDLWQQKWGYGVPIAADGFGYQLGWFLIASLALAVAVLVYHCFRTKEKDKTMVDLVFPWLLVLLILAESLFLFPFSNFVWQAIPLLKDINYPWTLLGPIGFAVCLLSGALGTNKTSGVIGLILVAGAIITVLPHAKPTSYLPYPDSYYQTNDGTTTSSNEFMPLWAKNWPKNRPAEKARIISGQGEIKPPSYNSRHFETTGSFSTPSAVLINTIYYPGWTAKVDKITAPIRYDNPQGIMEVSVPAGNHKITADFGETPLRILADLISVFSFGLVLLTGLGPSLSLLRRKIGK